MILIKKMEQQNCSWKSFYKKYASNNIRYNKEKIITASKGSVLIFNSSLWHGVVKNLMIAVDGL